MDVSIIIVNYNTCKLTLDALYSIYNSITNYSYEIIMIDNSSTDESVNRIKEEYPEVKLIENKENVGFAKANNQGIKIAKGRYIFLLNSDTTIKQNTIEILTKFMDDNSLIGASGCKVLLPDGTLDKACKRGFPTPSASFFYFLGLDKLFPDKSKYNQYNLSHMNPDKDYHIDSLVGACMFVRRKAIDEVGILDEDFFMYGEDIDWCYRLKEADWGIYYYPYTSITHYKGGSSEKKSVKIIYEFHRAMYLFYKKHYLKKYSIFTSIIVYVGISGKLLLSLLKNIFKTAR